ncbi:MAG: hypothetical protein WB780_07520 [Candidatus Acidiferrales bacterium]
MTIRAMSRAITRAFRNAHSRRRESAPRRHSSQSGYGYLMALFMVLAMLAGTMVFLENALTETARRREEEMIWRGNQYKRAIRLYFHKTGHYPQDIDALEKGLPQLHFLRHAYKDPMNTADGSWRYIYVNAAGQIIGSTRYASLQQMALIDNPQLMNQSFPQLGVSAASLANSSSSSAFGQSPQNSAFGNSSFGGSSFGSSNSSSTPGGNSPPSTSPPGTSPDGSTGAPTSSSTDSFAQSGGSSSTSGQSATTAQPGQPLGPDGNPLQNPILLQKPTGPVDGPVLGAFLTGIASTVDQPSKKWFHHAKKYKEWEFIWNPLDDQAAAAQQQATAIPILGQPAGAGNSAFGQGFGSAFGNGSTNGSGNSSPFGGSTPQPGPQGNPQAPQ